MKSRQRNEEENSRARSTDKDEKEQRNNPTGTTIGRSSDAKIKDFLLLKLEK
tara:strand:+ start:333 stop:488 length:156 start_codon:yes stop_codon:yes gene_type:complete